jgi:hypothetical protein
MQNIKENHNAYQYLERVMHMNEFYILCDGPALKKTISEEMNKLEWENMV